MAVSHYNRTVSGAFADSVKSEMDSGSGAGLIKVYTSPMPADTTVGITTQTLLGTCTFDATCGAVAAGTFTADAITPDSSADASGTAIWARIQDSDAVVVVDVDVTVTGGGGFIQMPTNVLVAGGPIAFTAFTATMP